MADYSRTIRDLYRGYGIAVVRTRNPLHFIDASELRGDLDPTVNLVVFFGTASHELLTTIGEEMDLLITRESRVPSRGGFKPVYIGLYSNKVGWEPGDIGEWLIGNGVLAEYPTNEEADVLAAVRPMNKMLNEKIRRWVLD